jgi:uncharacterized membrane protein (UPF0127 family)
MNKVIHQSFLLLIKILLLTQLIACEDGVTSSTKNPYKSYDHGTMTLASGKKLKIYLAITPKQQKMGLSHIKPSEFKDDEGMIFLDESYSTRQFWMPETHFNLDIFFLNEDLYVLDVHRNLQHYPKAGPRESIPLSKKVYCQHVLELKADSPYAKEIQPGMILKLEKTKNP